MRLNRLLYKELLSRVEIPDMYCIRQRPCTDSIEDVEAVLKKSVLETGVLNKIKVGDSVAVAVGSRELSDMVTIVRSIVEGLKDAGAQPFIVPAMGSHGGATAEGQREILKELRITQENVHAKIVSCMDTVRIGMSASGLPVEIDAAAWRADWIVPVNRVKPHTDFRGAYESGLMKMMAIGLGKQRGADICHSGGFTNMSRNIKEFGEVVLSTGKIAFLVAMIENSVHRVNHIEILRANEAADRELKLLEKAKRSMPSIPFEDVDLIVIDRIGKDISGTGMDTNVIGRSAVTGKSCPWAERIVVFGLTEKTHGNANGMGLADISTIRMFKAIDFDATYPNGITSNEPGPLRIPAIMPDDELAYRYGIKSCVGMYPEPIRIVHIKDTLSTHEMFVSERLMKRYGDGDGPYRPVFQRGIFKTYRCVNKTIYRHQEVKT